MRRLIILTSILVTLLSTKLPAMELSNFRKATQTLRKLQEQYNRLATPGLLAYPEKLKEDSPRKILEATVFSRSGTTHDREKARQWLEFQERKRNDLIKAFQADYQKLLEIKSSIRNQEEEVEKWRSIISPQDVEEIEQSMRELSNFRKAKQDLRTLQEQYNRLATPELLAYPEKLSEKEQAYRQATTMAVSAPDREKAIQRVASTKKELDDYKKAFQNDYQRLLKIKSSIKYQEEEVKKWKSTLSPQDVEEIEQSMREDLANLKKAKQDLRQLQEQYNKFATPELLAYLEKLKEKEQAYQQAFRHAYGTSLFTNTVPDHEKAIQRVASTERNRDDYKKAFQADYQKLLEIKSSIRNQEEKVEKWRSIVSPQDVAEIE